MLPAAGAPSCMLKKKRNIAGAGLIRKSGGDVQRLVKLT